MKDELEDVTDTIVDIDPERLSHFRLARYTDETKSASTSANKLSTTAK